MASGQTGPATQIGLANHFGVKQVVNGLVRPTYAGAAPGDGGALWALEQPGYVVRFSHTGHRRVLDLSREIKTGAEQGMLGMAFDPDFANDRRVFLHWTDRRGDTRVAGFQATDGLTAIDPTSERPLLHVDQPDENHNGGQLAFGPDGRLYLGLGDGGGAFDPRRVAQRMTNPFGKLLSTTTTGRGEWRVTAIGLRNPWRFSFDNALDQVWIGDVGQDRVEEVNRLRLDPTKPPPNLGWSVYEGTQRLRGHRLATSSEVVWPAATYTHDDGCSITGGVIYRGTQLPDLVGRYVYGDFCTGKLWSLRPALHGRAEDVRLETARVPQLTHIGEDSDGELVFASGAGAIYRAVPSSER